MFQPRRYQRRPIRLPFYDYRRAGSYFVTTNVHKRRHIFGRVCDGIMIPNDFGLIVDRTWRSIPEHFANVVIGEHIVMPNHFHGILWIIHDGERCVIRRDQKRSTLLGRIDRNEINDEVRRFGIPQFSAELGKVLRRFGAPVPDSLSTIIGAFKAAATKEIHRLEPGAGVKV